MSMLSNMHLIKCAWNCSCHGDAFCMFLSVSIWNAFSACACVWLAWDAVWKRNVTNGMNFRWSVLCCLPLHKMALQVTLWQHGNRTLGCHWRGEYSQNATPAWHDLHELYLFRCLLEWKTSKSEVLWFSLNMRKVYEAFGFFFGDILHLVALILLHTSRFLKKVRKETKKGWMWGKIQKELNH